MNKYRPYPQIGLSERTWPSRIITAAPAWCSVDLRDGNQALVNPMNPRQKMKYFKMLTKVGFKEIEVSFPAASKADFDFTRALIEQECVPEDVTIQVLTQARAHLIDTTMQAVRGAKRVIVHVYNSTSPAQREIVFRKSPKEIISIAVDGVKMIRDQVGKVGGEVVLEYSPESFSQTEVDFACEICNEVIEAWSPDAGEAVMINLPSTVEVSSPNVYADQIEYVNRNLIMRERVILSVHTHNDRGCAVAAAEMAQLAGAQRVEGTVFGNGERTGNADLVTLALNCFAQGIETGLDFSDLASIEEVYNECTGMQVPARHPYAGEYVFTAFSGSHQDAISKGLAHYRHNGGDWNVPYLPIDPCDVGKNYQAVIRINSQSGKGGAAYIMEQVFGFRLPKEMHPEFGRVVQALADTKGAELSNAEVGDLFTSEFVNVKGKCNLIHAHCEDFNADLYQSSVKWKAEISIDDQNKSIEGYGNGPVDAMVNALSISVADVKVISYTEHSLGEGSDARAAAYVQLEKSGVRKFGVGVDTDISVASYKALFSAVNRLAKESENAMPKVSAEVASS